MRSLARSGLRRSGWSCRSSTTTSSGSRSIASPRRLAAGPPLALRSLKANYLAVERVDFADFIDLEFQRHFHLMTTDDAREGFRAFGERRTARFLGR